MRPSPLCLIVAATTIWTGVAAAEDSLKGTYSFVGTLACLVAPDGFKNDSTGNPVIPNGASSFNVNNAAGQITYNGNGTGKAAGRSFTTTAPPAPGSAASAGPFSYSFTYAPSSNGAYMLTFDPGTYKGAFDFGPIAGQQFTIDVGYRAIQVSNDQKQITSWAPKPYVEKITYSGSPQNPISRICSWSGTQIRID